MAKNDNAHAQRIHDSLASCCGEEVAEEFATKYPLSKSANIEKKFAWAGNVCKFLDERYDQDTIMKVRMGCACGPETGKCKKVKALFAKAASPEELVEMINNLDLGYNLEYDGESYFLIYPQCYCSCVKNIPEQLPDTWCYCTIGYTKRMFEYVFDCEVEVELVNSVKRGAGNCRIRVCKKL